MPLLMSIIVSQSLPSLTPGSLGSSHHWTCIIWTSSCLRIIRDQSLLLGILRRLSLSLTLEPGVPGSLVKGLWWLRQGPGHESEHESSIPHQKCVHLRHHVHVNSALKELEVELSQCSCDYWIFRIKQFSGWLFFCFLLWPSWIFASNFSLKTSLWLFTKLKTSLGLQAVWLASSSGVPLKQEEEIIIMITAPLDISGQGRCRYLWHSRDKTPWWQLIQLIKYWPMIG